MRITLAATAALLLATGGHAELQQVRRGPAPEWAPASPMLAVPDNASGPIFTRRQDLITHLGQQGQEQYLGSRIKILQSNALELGNISIAWNPAAGAPIIHAIKVYRDAQVIDVLQKNSFQILQREDQLEAAKLDGVLTAVLHVPDLRVGDELEVELTTFGSDPVLLHKESGLLVLAPAPAPGRYHLRLSWDQGYKPNIKMTSDMERAAQGSDRAVDFRFDNPPLLSPPNDAPPRYRWQRVVQFSDFPDWAAVSRQFAPLFVHAATLAPNSPLKEEARRIAAAQPRPLDRAAAALKLVQQNVRYIYVGLNGGNLMPASAEDTWQRRYGDCKAKTALLLALLGELKIDAEAVLVNSSGLDDGLDQRLPMPQLFDHVLVRAHIDGASYWLDGTLPPVAGPSTRPLVPFSEVLPLTIAGSALEKLPWSPSPVPDEISLYEIDARAGFDKPAHVVTTNIVRGLKGLQEDVQYSALTSAQLLDAFRQNAIGEIWQTIDDVQWHYDEKAGASILKVSGTGAVDWQDDGNGGKSLALPGGGFNPPDRRARAADQDRDAPFYSAPEFECHATTVRLPTSTQPKQWSSKPSFAMHMFGRTYYRAWDLRDGSIRMVRASRIDQPEIDAATAQRDNGRIPSFNNSMGWISYDPAGSKEAVGNGEHVPATYDMDWSAADVPCMPAGADPSKQVARVGGAIITAADLDVETAAFSHSGTDEAAASRAALQRIVDRKLLLAAVPGSALDLASMQPAQRRDKENAILVAYAKSLQDGLPPPTQAQLSATREAHPNAFAAHQLLMLDQIRFEPTPEQVRKLGIIQPDHDLEAVTKHLKDLGITFERKPATLDTADASPSFLQAINALPKGEPFVVPSERFYTISVVVSRKAAPEPTADGRDVVTMWRRDRASQLLEDKLKALHAHSAITYAAGFGPNT